MSQRTMPVRADGWRPADRIYEGILTRAVSGAEADESRDGTAELMAGTVIVAVLAVGVLVMSKSAGAAIAVCGLLGAGVFLYTVLNARTVPGDRKGLLLNIGGPGRLPAGFLVHPAAWQAGMAEHVGHLPESQLSAAAELCHLFPGTVDDLVTYVGNIAIHVPAPQHATPEDVQRRSREIIRIGLPLLKEHVKTVPALPSPA